MTDMVNCRVCGSPSPLGTGECPECGAPLPRELPKEAAVVPERAVEKDTGEACASRKERAPVKHPVLRRVALFAAVCLVVELAFALWPSKPGLPGVGWDGDRLITPEGVWDYQADGFFVSNATTDGQYVLLQKPGDDPNAQSARRGMAELLSSVQLSYVYAPSGDYYLFDGRTLERTDWAEAGLTESGVVFYTRKDGDGMTLCWRNLNTGEDYKIQTFGEGVDLDILKYSADGTAVAYRWTAADGEAPGPYRLWRAKERKPVVLDVPGDLWGVGKGGETCLFWAENSGEGGRILYGWDGNANYGALRGYYARDYFLWRDGETVSLPNMLVMWSSNDYTQFLLRDDQEDDAGSWYYFDVDEMTAPRRLGIPADSYLYASGIQGAGLDTLTGHFYLFYGSGDNKVYYLTRKGELLLAEESLSGDFVQDPAGQTAVYLKNGEVYRLSVLPDDTLETQRLTHTNSAGSSSSDWGLVTAFAANKDLTHIYYIAQSPEGHRGGKTLYHWHDGESRVLDFEVNGSYGSLPMTVTGGGGCYFTYTRNLYYTANDAPPTLLLEEVGMSSFVQLVGARQWPLLSGAVWEDGRNQNRYWLLDEANAPVELTEWYPKEEKA